MALTKIPSSLLDTSGGFDLQGNITLGDNEQIQLGDSTDLAIYHDGSHSFITDSGTGNLRLQGTNLALQNATGTKNYFLGSDGGASTIYYDNSPKIATSSAGATVTGTLTVTGDLDITGDINSYNVTDLDVTDQTITLGAGQTEANSGGSGIIIDGSNASILWDETNDEWDFNKGINTTGTLNVRKNGTGQNIAIFYSDLGTNDRNFGILSPATDSASAPFEFTTGNSFQFTIDAVPALNIASDRKIGIGTTNPSHELEIHSASPTVEWSDSDNNYRSQITQSGSAFYFDADAGAGGSSSMRFRINGGTEAVRISAGGNVGIGNTNPSGMHSNANKLVVGTGSGDQGMSVFAGTSTGRYAFARAVGNNTDAYDGGMAYDGDRNLTFHTNANSERMRIDGSGNVGIAGTPPSDTNTGYPLLSIGETTAIQGLNDSNESFFGNNAIWKSDNSWEYVKNVRAVQMAFADGDTIFRQAASGTAGNDITWSESMRITNTGNCGIGTSNPARSLDVNGSIRVANANSVEWGGTNEAIVGDTGGALIYKVGGAEIMRNTSTGLGIGTTSPQAPLHARNGSSGVSSYTAGTRAIIEGTATTYLTLASPTTSNKGILFADSDDSDAGFITYDPTDNLDFGTAGSTRMRIDSNGDIGINTSSPIDGSKLDVVDSDDMTMRVRSTGSSSAAIRFQNSTTGTTTNDGLFVGIGTGEQGYLWHYDNNPLIFATNNTERYRINSTGTLISGSSSFAHNTYAHAAVFTRNSTPLGTVVIEDSDVSSGIGNTVLNCYLRDQDPASFAVFVKFTDGGGTVGSITHNDDGGGVTYNTTSDYRLKENVNYDWDGLSLLNQLKPAKFNFIRQPSKTLQGFLAHEVKDIVPSSVQGDKDHMEPTGTVTDSDGNVVYENVYEHFCKTDEGQTWTRTGEEPVYQELDYSRIVPLLTKAIQEQQTIIEDLTARITELEG